MLQYAVDLACNIGIRFSTQQQAIAIAIAMYEMTLPHGSMRLSNLRDCTSDDCVDPEGGAS